MGISADLVKECVLRESWEYADADTQLLTHNIHRYSGKFIPQIASRAVSILTESGQLVLDPYCGSGTTLLECAKLKRRAIGVDISPLAVLIAKVKTTPIARDLLEELIGSGFSGLSQREALADLPLFTGLSAGSERAGRLVDPRLENAWFQKWFQPQVLAELVAIDVAIQQIPESALQDLARVAFSDILRKSSNAHSGYPNVMFCRCAPKKERPTRAFLKAVSKVAQMVLSLQSVDADWSGVKVVNADARLLDLKDDAVDAIVSHPPYIGSIPYAEYGSLSLQWLGHDWKELDKHLTGGRRQSSDVVARFEEGYLQMLKQSSRVLKDRRHMFLMVGNPVVRGTLIDLAEMTIDLASQSGFRLVVRTERQGVNRRANKMGAEHLLFFQKAGHRKRTAPT